MKVSDLKALEPKLATYELKPNARYLICADRPLPADVRTRVENVLRQAMETHSVQMIAFLDFIPTIFELEAES